MPDIDIHTATLDHLPQIARLFDAYRCWYGEESDLDSARHFLAQRLQNSESMIFFATLNDAPAGFTQLYPLFSSVAMEPIWLLNDLYVDEASRRQGIASVLLETAAEFARQMGAIRLELEVEISNPVAQKLYEKHGWSRNQSHHFYSLTVDE